MTMTQAVVLYILGGLGLFYLGMRYDSYLWRVRQRRDIQKAYDRGWMNAFGFLQKIEDNKTDRESQVRIVGQEWGDSPGELKL
jgi:hypothetical protein